MNRLKSGGPERAALREHAKEQAYWDAVVARDARADGAFVYAVSSTGVFCRPSCASRRPKREHVRFFESPASAVGAGYRACRRCRPDQPSASDPWIEKVRRACVYLANTDGHVSLAHLARRIGGSPYHLQRSFKRIVGVTPREYADACRLRKMKRRLRAGARVTDALFDAGYASSSRFYERAASKLAMTPQAYRRGGAGREIAYAIDDSPLGRLLVAATAKGICAVFMSDSDTKLERALRDEFPSAALVSGHKGLKKWTREIVRHLHGRRPRFELPLDVQATAFQWQVWNALSRIPYGETRTYKEVAASIGRPSAVRAVAHACATNPVSVVIPCHRVVRTSGQLAGYRWGLERKKALLAAEHRMNG
ncbi:MAG TPA: bifunctional DNA-binding transcriptional regulator/O6-methylguanine-DNA methyltransferase Ada [Vicinamibacterales bacterium]|nr:bifunctional DNA-binding transcriptional regulator/O6-methylguanine-DNA methyltransferase Ada [Vicinamibacterales bacterium]